jgi:hypothetical protein
MFNTTLINWLMRPTLNISSSRRPFDRRCSAPASHTELFDFSCRGFATCRRPCSRFHGYDVYFCSDCWMPSSLEPHSPPSFSPIATFCTSSRLHNWLLVCVIPDHHPFSTFRAMSLGVAHPAPCEHCSYFDYTRWRLYRHMAVRRTLFLSL